MTRRTLLGALIGAMTLDPEKLLWVPGKKLISIPKPQVTMAPAWRVITYYSNSTIASVVEILTCDHIPTSFADVTIQRTKLRL